MNAVCLVDAALNLFDFAVYKIGYAGVFGAVENATK
jgi:hypothetical protein